MADLNAAEDKKMRPHESIDNTKHPNVIYDFGMNNGDDIEYYLKKATKVVGVEANTALVEACSRRYHDAITSGHLVLLNCVLSVEEGDELTPFYIHKTNHVLSQLHAPSLETKKLFETVFLPRRKPSEIVAAHGDPHYIKIDVEGYDRHVLLDLFQHGIFPDFISAEAHSPEIFCELVVAGYKAFNLVEGKTVPSAYQNTEILSLHGLQRFSFAKHSAGPYGRDLTTPWLDAQAFIAQLASAGFGWRDIHATSLIEPDSNAAYIPKLSTLLKAFPRSVCRAIQKRLAR